MVEEQITDGKRIAQLLASEVTGRTDGPLGRLAVTNADPEVEPDVDGARAYDLECDGESFASVFVQPDRIRIDCREGIEAAVETAERVGLRVRPKAVEPPQAIVFVEHGAAVKQAIEVLGAAVEESDRGPTAEN